MVAAIVLACAAVDARAAAPSTSAALPPAPVESEAASPAPLAPRASTSAAPAHRLRVGLVLSGGGARGAAHIGVLKMLDQLHVPIDAIAGTSMGAVVGGLYASGMSGQQIEDAMASVDWQVAFRDHPPRDELDYRRKQEEERYLVNLPLGLQGRRLVIPKGLIQGQKLTETLRQLTLPVATITDFDHLPTAFRAIATNLETGAVAVLGDGDLATAMRASMAVPGVFAPVEYRGQLLVDGGITDYLPIDIARAMGVDVLIVVDSGYTLQPRKNLVSLPGITQQMLSILLRRNIERQLATLTQQDVIVSPNLGDFSSYDFVDTLKIVNAGAAAVEKIATRLRAFELPEAQYAQYLAQRQSARSPLPVVQFVRVVPDSTTYQRPIDDLFDGFKGQALNPEAVQHQEELLYGHGFLELLDYRLQQDSGGQYGLDFTALRNSWGPNYLRVGVALQTDFKGNTVFNAGGRLDVTEINSLGAESVWDVQVGTAPLLATEFFQPLSNVTQYFVAPTTQVEAHDIPQVANGRQIGEYREQSFDYGLAFGREFGNWGEIRIGALNLIGNEHVSQGDFNVPTPSFNVDEYFARFGFDDLDDAHFPHSGQALTTQLSFDANSDGQEGSDLFTLDWRIAHSWARNTLGLWLTGGSTVGGSQTNVRTYFPLGGFLNLSGVQTDTLAGPQFAIGRLIYMRKIGNGGEGILDVPAYLGASFETGNVWSSRADVSASSLRKDGAVFFGADTYVGPAYLAVGYDQSGSVALYVFVGRAF